MENVISILTLQPEEMPKWLMDYKPGDTVSLRAGTYHLSLSRLATKPTAFTVLFKLTTALPNAK